MKIGKQTAALLREAIIFSHIQGARWAYFSDDWNCDGEGYPKDSEVLTQVFNEVKMFRDIYPNLYKLTKS